MLSSCLMTSSTLQSSNPPCKESRFRSRSLGIKGPDPITPLLLRTPIKWLITCDGVGAEAEEVNEEGDPSNSEAK